MRRRRLVSLAVAGILVVLAVSASVLNANRGDGCLQPAASVPPDIPIDATAATLRLAAGVRFETISHDDPAQSDRRPFAGLRELLHASYPHVRRTLTREVVNESSLLHTWPGTNPALKPILLLAHLDVVPVEPGTEPEWSHPPFAGKIADGYIWGRGAIDDKGAVFGIMEALEILAREGRRPRRTIYVAFGHDEESRGREGAAAIAELLRARGVTLQYLVDEGLAVADGFISGLARPVAMIGTAEKGWLTLELTTTDAGGHASMPPSNTAIGILATAIHRLESNPMPTTIEPPVSELFGCLAPEMSFVQRLAFSNLFLFGPLVERQLAASTATNALVRTTTAVTMARAGTKDNVLPTSAMALVNFRILPGQSTASVTAHAERVINDRRVTITSLKREEPSPVASSESDGFRTLATTIRQVFPDALVAPALVVVRTDSSHFLELSEAAYRFRPLRLTPADLRRIHGTDERLSVEGYRDLIKFYVQLLRNAAF